MFDKKKNQAAYAGMVQKLYKHCYAIQNENERCVLRINALKKMLRLRLREVEFLKKRLDEFNDPWRALPMVAPNPKRKIEQKRGPKPKSRPNAVDEAKASQQQQQQQQPQQQQQQQQPPLPPPPLQISTPTSVT